MTPRVCQRIVSSCVHSEALENAGGGWIRDVLAACGLALLAAHCAASGSTTGGDAGYANAGNGDATVSSDGAVISLGDDGSGSDDSGGIFVATDGAGSVAGALTV